jgi:hypothetical protein
MVVGTLVRIPSTGDHITHHTNKCGGVNDVIMQAVRQAGWRDRQSKDA